MWATRRRHSPSSRSGTSHKPRPTRRKMVEAAAVVMPVGWRKYSEYDQAYELGERVTQYDVDAFGISLTGRATGRVILAYHRGGGCARKFIILLRSQSATRINGIAANLSSYSIQEHALNSHCYNQPSRMPPSRSNGPRQTPASLAFARRPPEPGRNVHSPPTKS